MCKPEFLLPCCLELEDVAGGEILYLYVGKRPRDEGMRARDSCGMTRKMPTLPRGTHAPYFRRLFVATAGFHELHTLDVSFFANHLLVHSFDHRPPSMRFVSPPTCRTLRSGPSKLAMDHMQQR